jgi:Protein of unknown function (DUF3667)
MDATGKVAAAQPFGRRAVAPTARCGGCGGDLHGRFCSRCGGDSLASAQASVPPRAASGDSLVGLVVEGVRTVVDFGGSVRRTLWRVIFDPGRLTRDWWQGRREGLVSPIRLITGMVLLLSALVAVTDFISRDKLQVDLVGMAQRTAYLILAAVTLVMGFVTPVTIKATMRPTHYQNIVAALYEGAFVGIFYIGILLMMLVASLLSFMHGPFDILLAGFALPIQFAPLIVVVHLYAHLRGAYGVSRIGAVARTLLTMVVSIVLLMAIWAHLAQHGLLNS